MNESWFECRYGTVMGGLLSNKWLDVNVNVPFMGPKLDTPSLGKYKRVRHLIQLLALLWNYLSLSGRYIMEGKILKYLGHLLRRWSMPGEVGVCSRNFCELVIRLEESTGFQSPQSLCGIFWIRYSIPLEHCFSWMADGCYVMLRKHNIQNRIYRSLFQAFFFKFL